MRDMWYTNFQPNKRVNSKFRNGKSPKIGKYKFRSEKFQKIGKCQIWNRNFNAIFLLGNMYNFGHDHVHLWAWSCWTLGMLHVKLSTWSCPKMYMTMPKVVPVHAQSYTCFLIRKLHWNFYSEFGTYQFFGIFHF